MQTTNRVTNPAQTNTAKTSFSMHVARVLLLYSFVVACLADLLFKRYPDSQTLIEKDNIIGVAPLAFVQRTLIGEGENATVYSVAPKVPVGTALEDDDGYLYERLHLPSPLGEIEVVVKVFRKLNKGGAVLLCDGTRVVKTCVDKEDAKYWKHAKQMPSATIRSVHTRVDAGMFATTEFVNEALVHSLLSTLIHLGLTPHIASACHATIKPAKNLGYLFVERLDTTLQELLDDEDLEIDLFDRQLSCTDIAAMYFQLLHTLYVCQHVFEFKHHDLHPENVFITCITDESMYRGQRLCEYTHFKYWVGDTAYYLPNGGFLLKFADFGLSSVTAGRNGHHKRVGRVDMTTFDDETEEWGIWSNDFVGNEGYDTQFFFAEIPYRRDTRFGRSKKLQTLFRTLKQTATTKHGRNTRGSQHRPRVVSRRPAQTVLEMVFSQPAESFYDFRTAPNADAAVLEMGRVLPSKKSKKKKSKKKKSKQH